MNRFFIYVLFSILILPSFLFSYHGDKKGVILSAIDYARTPEALVIQADVSPQVESVIGKGISAHQFLLLGWRSVGVTIQNTTNKPMMLAPYFGPKTAKGLVEIVTSNNMWPASYPYYIGGAACCGWGALLSFVSSAAARDNQSYVARQLFGWFFLVTTGFFIGAAIQDSYLASEFLKAIMQKYDEIKFTEEALILPGQTIYKLLLCPSADYISRFPLVIYPLENREDMLVFDVDLRA